MDSLGLVGVLVITWMVYFKIKLESNPEPWEQMDGVLF
jgi:hypothetical protein